MESKNTFYDDIDYKPDADGMINNMDYGGLDLHSCIQELKDNSDDKNSTQNNIYLLSIANDSRNLHQLIMTDNGPGMTPEEFAYSIILAKKMAHNQGDIGKFGMGLNNATMAIGNKIVIIAKTADGSSRGLYMDLTQMRRDNTYKPTLICEGAESFKPLIARDSIYDAFMSQSSGVLISITDIKMNIDDIEVEAKKLQTTLNLGYKTNKSCTRIYTSPTSEYLTVNEVDVFYKSNMTAVDYQSETTLRVFVKSDKKSVEGVYEVLSGKRIKGQYKGETTWYDAKSKSIYLKHKLDYKTTPTGKITYKHNSTQVTSLPTGNYYDIDVRFICVKENIYDSEGEDPQFAGVPHKRRGLWFYRNIRCVGKCIELGQSLNDESNRQRMEVTYPADLDYPMGMRIQKQMGTISSTSIYDALITIWEQQNKEIIRVKQKERKEKKIQVINEEDDEEEDEYEQLAKHLSSEEDVPVIIKAKRPIVAPSPLLDRPNSQEDNAVEENAVEENAVEENAVEDNAVEENAVEENAVEEQEQAKEDLVEQKVVEQEEPVVTTNTVSNNLQPINIIIQPQLEPQANKNITSVGGYIRNTSKSQNDVILKLLSIIENPKITQKLQELSANPSIITHPKWTQIYAQLEVLENELSN